MKNYRTPRTLAESSFTLGYPSIEERVYAHERAHRIVERIVLAMLAGLLLSLAAGWL